MKEKRTNKSKQSKKNLKLFQQKKKKRNQKANVHFVLQAYLHQVAELTLKYMLL